MPIQLTQNYNQIPDVEDVSPVAGTIEKQNKRIFKIIAVLLGGIVLIGALHFFGVKIPTPFGVMFGTGSNVLLYQTSMGIGGDRLTLLTVGDMQERGFKVGSSLSFGNVKTTESDINKASSTPSKFFVNSQKTFQEILGFGGAFTEAAAYNFFQLPASVQKRVIELYFGEDGIGYSVGRVHINSCDFSLKSYSFDDIAGDYALQYFDTEVTHDNAQMLPLIRLAMSAAKSSGLKRGNSPKIAEHGINLLASPWSPPSWMKRAVKGHQNMTGSAEPHGLIDTDAIKKAWALYIVKFAIAYEAKGAPLWAITPQNEPEFAAPWEACAFNSTYERDFINGYLGPTMKQYGRDEKVLAFDHNKDHLLAWTKVMMDGNTKSLAKGGESYVDGMAFHWYTGSMDRLMDGTYGYDALNKSYHYAGPNKILMGTEGCSCPNVKLNDWLRAERLAHDVIFDLNNYAQGWIDWNLLVDNKGGPNHLGNMCDAPLVTKDNYTDIHVQPKYYYFGHISKFVPPGSVRVESRIVGNYQFADVDPNVRAGMELGMYECEKSVRQRWYLNNEMQLELFNTALDTEAKDGYIAHLCIGEGVEGWEGGGRPYLKIVICDLKLQNALSFRATEEGQLIDKKSGKCLSFVEDVREPGALLELADCEIVPINPTSMSVSSSISGSVDNNNEVGAGIDNNNRATGPMLASAHQLFDLARSGELISTNVLGLCVTAGWPMLTGAAFKDPTNGKISAILLNEAMVDTNVVLRDSVRGDVTFGINERSMQTIVY